MKKTFTIRFGRSTSQNYPYAVEKAKGYETYTEQGEGKNITHTVTFFADQIDDFLDLYDLVGNWKSTSIFIDGELIPPHRLRFMWCFKQCVKAYDHQEYCYGKDDAHEYNDNDFGCRHTGVNLYAWEGLAAYGKMDSNGVFHVNKEKLKHDILKNVEEYSLCPAFDMERVMRGLNSIPSKIDPRVNKDWEYVIGYEDGKEFAYAVRKKSDKEKFIVRVHPVFTSEVEDKKTRKSTDYTSLPIAVKPVQNRKTNHQQKTSSPQGCATSVLALIFLPFLVLSLWLLSGCTSSPSSLTFNQEQGQVLRQGVEAVGQQPSKQENTVSQQPTEKPGQPTQQTTKSKPKPAVAIIPVVVSRVIDGDTFEAKVNGKTERIRLIGVNTPEIHGKVEKYGKEASNYTKKQLEGKKVYLELDVQHRDKYGRLLAYVWMSQPTKIDDRTIREQMFNARLLLNGYAEQMTIPPNVKYADKFTVYVREAREAKRGLWATTSSNQTPKQTQPSKQNQKQTQSSKPRYVKGSGGYNCPPGYPVKGNINSKGEKIYHVPGGQFYDRTKPEYCFCTPADAEAAGFRASKR